MSNYIHHSANNRNFIIVEVDKGGYNFTVDESKCLNYCIDGFGFPINKMLPLPVANYHILFIAEEATEEQAEQIVDFEIDDFCLSNGLPYKDYRDYEKELEEDMFFGEAYLGMATESLTSLVRANFPNHLNHKHLILEQI